MAWRVSNCLYSERSRIPADIRSSYSIVAPGKMLDRLLASDFALFGATLWPCASFEKLKIITYLVVWLFLWDDRESRQYQT